MRRYLLVLSMMIPALYTGQAQSVRSLVNGGNDLYSDRKFTDAEVNYRKALEKEKDLVQGHFNLGDALARQGKNEEAAREFEQAMKLATQRDTKAYANYNIGNTHMADQRYEDAVRSYVEALKLNPKDEEAKYNLSYALEKLRRQQQQNQQKQNKNDKDQNKKDQQKPDKNQNQDQKKDQDKNKQNKPDQQRNNQQQEKRMSKADAERILDVLKNSEKDVQKKLRARTAERAKTDKDW